MISTLNLVTKLGFNLILAFCLTSFLHAQKHDYNWLFGYQVSDTMPGNEVTILNFNISPVEPEHFPEVTLEFDAANLVVSDRLGNLQFYSNGCEIFNTEHEVIENGSVLGPGDIFEEYCLGAPIKSYPSGTQSLLTLPSVDQDSVYYVFYQTLEYHSEFNNYSLWWHQLRYARIDMTFNLGKGKVVERDYMVLDSTASGLLTAVKSADAQKWWLVSSKELQNEYHVFLVDSSGVHQPIVQTIGNIPVPGGFGGGQAKFSPDGTLYARYSPDDDLILFDFDRETGLLSNFRFIPVELDGEVVGGIEFSASGQFLYVASNTYLLQFDLWADDVEASMQIVGEYDGYVSPFPTTFYRIERGPDCRIYVFCGSCDVIHIIQKPDKPGLDCQFEQHVMQLPFYVFRTAPHFPNYRLGPVGDEGEPCTPLITSSSTVISTQTKVEVFPNPSQENIHLQLPSSLRSFPYRLEVFDQLGQRLLNTTIQSQQEFIDIQILPQGMYFWKLTKGASLLDNGKLIKQ